MGIKALWLKLQEKMRHNGRLRKRLRIARVKTKRLLRSAVRVLKSKLQSTFRVLWSNGNVINSLISRLGLVSNTILGVTMWLLWVNVPDAAYGILSLISGLFIGALGLILRKEELRFSVDNLEKTAIFLKVDQGRASVIEMGGRPIKVIYGGELPPFNLSWFGLWWFYQAIVYWTVGLYPYVPYFTIPKTYALPRYRMQEQGGKITYVAVQKGDPGYISDHVRNALTTKGYEYSGVDVQKIPFTVDLSAQCYIARGREIDALYGVEAWNVLQDQAIGATLRGVMRSHITLDDILGALPKNIWEDRPTSTTESIGNKVANLVKAGLDAYRVEIDVKSTRWFGFRSETKRVSVGLSDLGIIIPRIDITDFRDELTTTQREQLLAAVFGREAGRAADLKGQGVAAAQRKLKEAHGVGDGASSAIIEADALVRAAGSNGGAVDAIAAAVARNFMKGK